MSASSDWWPSLFFSVQYFSREKSTPVDTKHIMTIDSRYFIMARPCSWDTPGFICIFPTLLVLGIDVWVVPKYFKLVKYKSKFWISINNHKKNSQIKHGEVNSEGKQIVPNNMLIYRNITFYLGLQLTEVGRWRYVLWPSRSPVRVKDSSKNII